MSATVAPRDRAWEHGPLLVDRRGMKRDEHAAEALEWGEGQPALGAAAEATLQIILADRQDRGHRQVPDAGDDRQFDHLEGGAGNLLRAREELGYRGHEC